MLDGRPLVYASLGTARALQSGIFRLVAQACDELNLQLVITLGGRSNPDSLADLPGRPVVVGDAPQLELLRGAEIVITHGGLNTVLETLREGKPILAIPIAYDQPAVADRLAWLGVAEVVPAKGVTSARILSSLQKLLANGSYRSAALILQDRIRNDNGLLRAADLIEAALPRRISLSGS
jgi:MGT family glycosyltransferase